ncbi:Glycosyl hydrolase [Phytophthora megakarya]|uniref:cellulose 1,4-beta-cellobiosidase (non-reducing end) n=1 Tax=Phytophthora megakarya TaxID=4795 RepID=A0A225V673_9STRA|nr:Glycosyl hydrolase [Phytophthora megakarya]
MKISNTVAFAATAMCTLNALSLAQQPGARIPELHPPLPSQYCTVAKNVLQNVDHTDAKVAACVTEQSSVVIDSNWRETYAVGTTNSCVSDGKWNMTTCSSSTECAKICGLEGVDYTGNFSITTLGQELELKLQTPSSIGSRVYMLDTSGKKYKQFRLLNQEFTFDVDVSNLPCGSNGALYFVKMDPDGDVHFVNGEANLNGSYGSCCTEMDIWEANKCGNTDETRYTGWCDKNGCDFNPFRMGLQDFYGRGKQFSIDTTRPFSVITQFVTADNTDTGELVEIRRLYKQDGRVVLNPSSTWTALNGIDSITEAMCNMSKTYFDDPAYVGNLAQLGRDLVGGMTLAMSVWVDYGLNMSWLDSHFPGDDPTVPGGLRGNCPFPGGDPETVFAENPNAGVKFLNIRSGDLGTTY